MLQHGEFDIPDIEAVSCWDTRGQGAGAWLPYFLWCFGGCLSCGTPCCSVLRCHRHHNAYPSPYTAFHSTWVRLTSTFFTVHVSLLLAEAIYTPIPVHPACHSPDSPVGVVEVSLSINSILLTATQTQGLASSFQRRFWSATPEVIQVTNLS